MAENTNADNAQNEQNAQQAVFSLVTQYAVDVSLEVPTPPYKTDKGDKVDVNIDVGVASRKLEKDNLFEVRLKLRGEATDNADQTRYLCEVEYGGAFVVDHVADQHITPLLCIDGASLLFPFARRVFIQLIQDAGYKAMQLDPVNFHQLYTQAQQQNAQKAAESASEAS